MVRNLPAQRRPRFDSWVGKISWRKEWLPTPVFFPGEFHGQRKLVGYSPWGDKVSDLTERLKTHILQSTCLRCNQQLSTVLWVPAHSSGISHMKQDTPNQAKCKKPFFFFLYTIPQALLCAHFSWKSTLFFLNLVSTFRHRIQLLTGKVLMSDSVFSIEYLDMNFLSESQSLYITFFKIIGFQ